MREISEERGVSVKTVGEIADIRNGPFGSMLHSSDYVCDGTPIITVEHLGEYGIEAENAPRVSDADKARLSAFELKRGDIVFSRVGSVDRNAIVSEYAEGYLFSGRLLRIRITDKDVSPKYLAFFFRSGGFRRAIIAKAVGQTMASLNTRIMSAMEVSLPKLAEQRKIAQKLEDFDSLLQSLDTLIEKKRSIKTATIQALLSGRTRLPGNRTAWQTVRMGDLGTPYGGLNGVSSTDFSSDGASRYIPFMNVMTDVSIDKSWVEPVRVEHPESQTAVQVNDLLFNGSSETPGEVGLCSVLTEDIGTVYLNSFCFGFRLHSPAEISSLFLAYWFRGALGRKVMSALAQGATRYNLAKSALKKIELTLPERAEQDAIVDTLQAMSQELSGLTAQRDKISLLRTGMTQSLLAGNIRLV